LLYTLSWVLISLRVRSTIQNAQQNSSHSASNYAKFYFSSWFIALLLHIFALHFPLILGKAMALNFFTLASYVMWFISLILFITTFKRRIESLAIFILPYTILSIILSILLSTNAGNFIQMKSGLGLHVLLSLLAYSLLLLASFQALLLSYQDMRLHTHQISGLMRALPSLEDMEHLLFRFITIGVVLLTFSLISGFIYLDDLFAQRVAHKTILSLVAWVVFTILLFGRWKYGWRGRKAVRWNLAGFIILMLAFFGSKFIQEFIL
ncbi:MAG TPA: phosphohydrolase, partial [Leucothrix sp.]|nr:phosphohydrolase [Leucothrix sp.]